MKITKKSKITASKQLKKITAAEDDIDDVEIDWHENPRNHPLFNLYIDTVDNMNIEPFDSVDDAGVEVVKYLDLDKDDTIKYIINSAEEAKFMDLLGRMYTTDTNPNRNYYFSHIKEFIQKHMIDNNQIRIDWHENQLDHPLFDLSGDAENQLHIWGEPSTQGRMGSIYFMDTDTDKTLYLVDYEEYCDFMDDLGYQYVHDKHPNDAEYVNKIVEFIKQYEYKDGEAEDEDDIVTL